MILDPDGVLPKGTGHRRDTGLGCGWHGAQESMRCDEEDSGYN